MPVVLIIDDHPFTRMEAINAVHGTGFKIRTLTNVELTDQMIGAVEPDLVLINRQPEGFDGVRVFMHVKEKFPCIPVLYYALKSDTAVRSLQQSIQMAMDEARQGLCRQNIPEIRPSDAVRIYNNKGKYQLMKTDRLSSNSIKH